MKKNILAITFLSLMLFVLASCGKKQKTMSYDQLLFKSLKLAQEGKWTKAGDCASEAAKLNSKKADALILEGICLEYEGKLKLAIGRLEAAANLEPDNFMAQYTLGYLLLKEGSLGKCIAPLKKAKKLNPDNMDAVVLLAEAMNKQKLMGAATYYKTALRNKRFQKNPAPWNQLGIIFTRKKDNNSALKCFIKAYKLDPDNYMSVLNLAVFLDKYMNRKAKAKSFYYKYLKLTANNPALEAKRKEIARRIREISS
jgi:tetratricopeptide (TPR) repeat protein